MARQHASGHIRVLPRKDGDVFFAKLKIPRPDGTVYEPQRRLGKVWTKRSRPPAGYLTSGMAQARLEAILAGDDPLVNIEPARHVVTFGQLLDEWLADRERECRPSTMYDYRSTAKTRLRPFFGSDTPIDEIAAERVNELRAEMADEGLTGRTINKTLALAHGVFKLAERHRARLAGLRRILDAVARPVAVDVDVAAGEVGVAEAQRQQLLRRGERSVRVAQIVERQVALMRPGAGEAGGVTGASERSGGRVVVERPADVGDEHAVAVGGEVLAPRELVEHAGGLIPDGNLREVQEYMGHASVTTTELYAHFVPRHDAATRGTEGLAAILTASEKRAPSVPRAAVQGPD